MSVPRRRYTIAILAADAANMQARMDSNIRFGRGVAGSKWANMFTSEYVDDAGVEWRVASGMLTEAQIARFKAMVRASVILQGRETAQTLKHAEGDGREAWKLRPKERDDKQ